MVAVGYKLQRNTQLLLLAAEPLAQKRKTSKINNKSADKLDNVQGARCKEYLVGKRDACPANSV